MRAASRVLMLLAKENTPPVPVVVLERDLDLDVVLLALEEEHLRMDRGLVLVQVL